MNLSKTWKRFWTLNRHHAAGFTLVELIVVIAILAVLAGVAVPAYSGYTVRANKGADESLISEVSDALQMYYYDKADLNACGYVILHTDGTPASADAEFGEKAMANVFGADWRNTVSLSYGKWVNDGLVRSALAEGADKVNGSSYLTGNDVDALLAKVTRLTAAASRAFGNSASNDNTIHDQVGALVSSKALFYMENICGTKEVTGKNGPTKEFKNINNNQLANLLVVGAAMDYGMGTPFDLIIDPYAKLVAISSNPELSKMPLTHGDYSGQTMGAGFEAMNTALDGANDFKTIQSLVSNFYKSTEESRIISAYNKLGRDQGNPVAKNDKAAFANLMSAVVNISPKIKAEDLEDLNYFGSDTISGQFTNYTIMTALFSRLSEAEKNELTAAAAANSNSIIVILSGTKDGCSIIVDPAESFVQ